MRRLRRRNQSRTFADKNFSSITSKWSNQTISGSTNTFGKKSHNHRRMLALWKQLKDMDNGARSANVHGISIGCFEFKSEMLLYVTIYACEIRACYFGAVLVQWEHEKYIFVQRAPKLRFGALCCTKIYNSAKLTIISINTLGNCNFLPDALRTNLRVKCWITNWTCVLVICEGMNELSEIGGYFLGRRAVLRREELDEPIDHPLGTSQHVNTAGKSVC